ncbi:glycine betaine ABC transporter substrate-binding protein [Dethiobacter alkaliphilus]|uniref:Substrate-binding region of ABC-type glycine betaine transport system n=1 Tax=Dethiobacter alkaliphilus AHT 1 TaxID=555088 RepID=C0GK35_DETAL|nr:glycine betaine ABC transporter substrate-binding protein [Dethiobacter alkaliphilus]EEG76305.1 Substrate-binding region of ABC-type glycine betaine transport system [Dethiobacter alkaliphilus AHT 1]
MKVKGRFLIFAALFLLVALTALGCGDNQAEGWVFATDHEYSVRPDGYPGVTDLYGFEFDDVIIMDQGITYQALRDGDVAVAMGFATDGRIAAFDLVNLEDDKEFHPVYNVAPNVLTATLEEYPEIEGLLNSVVPLLDEETMSELNARVDIEGYEPDEVAYEFLLDNGLISETAADGDKGPISIGSKEFTEQLLLGQMAVLLLENDGFQVEDNTGLGGTSIVREALENDEIQIYWEYTGTAWMTHFGNEEAITNPEECYALVKEEDANNGITWLDYSDFNNTYTFMMRRADADSLGITTISDLAEAINEGVPAP